MKNPVMILLTCGLLLVPGIYSACSVGKDEISVEREAHRTVYSMRGIPICLVVFHGGDEGVWGFGPPSPWERSDQPIDWQIRVMDKLLRKALSDQKEPPRTLLAGRLEEFCGSSNEEMSRRLANAARTSPYWDREKGRGLRGDDNGAVRAILNEGNIYRELVDMFKRHGLTITVSAVEKVRVKDKLPFDCQVWFSVERREG